MSGWKLQVWFVFMQKEIDLKISSYMFLSSNARNHRFFSVSKKKWISSKFPWFWIRTKSVFSPSKFMISVFKPYRKLHPLGFLHWLGPSLDPLEEKSGIRFPKPTHRDFFLHIQNQWRIRCPWQKNATTNHGLLRNVTQMSGVYWL